MLFKLLGVELANRQQAPGVPKFRQIFLTQSHVLAHRVEEYYLQLVRAAELTRANPTGAETLSNDLFQLDEEDDERADLPSRFSELQDDHFPLFVTFDQVSRTCDAFKPKSDWATVAFLVTAHARERPRHFFQSQGYPEGGSRQRTAGFGRI